MLYNDLFFALLAGGVACIEIRCSSANCTTSTLSIPTPIPTFNCGNKTQEECGGVCGDGKVQTPYEECDLGPKLNGAPGSGCSKDCKKVPVCGNGELEPPEECDLGPQNGQPNSGCSINCTITPVCGNGKLEPGEECDAGPLNGAYNSGCSTNCTLCGYCGDGIVDDAQGEECDLGWQINGTPGANCSANCTLNPQPCGYCGDGIVQPGEQCDYGKNNGQPDSPCSVNCTWVCGPVCGNGITEWPEECDDGDLNGTPQSNCTTNCTLVNPCGHPKPPVCGNGLVEYPEECDNGVLNGIPGGNCTSDCKKWCDFGPDLCHPRCGDGQLDPGEECDDGPNNGKPWSKCDETCHVKPNDDWCQACNPNPFFNKCTITTSCINTPSGRDYCACRAGYRANGLDPTDPRQFRLEFPGQEYRVFVAPGIDCDTLCTNPYPGPESCQEVPVRFDC